MANLLEITWSTVATILLSAMGIYAAVVVLTRISGKRSFSKMSSFDFAMTIAVGSIIATTILSASVDLAEGVVALTVVYLLQMTIAFGRRYTAVHRIVDNSPLLLMEGERILMDNMRKARVSVTDLRSKLREANVCQLTDIKMVVFETTGDISVMHATNASPLDPWLLEDVRRE